MATNNFLEELIEAEVFLKKRQSELGYTVITVTCVVCVGLGLLVIMSGGMFNEHAPEGTTAQIILSEQFAKLIAILSVPFTVGMTAGIILVKSSVKNVTRSYCDAVASIEKMLGEDEDMIQK